ncbi:hypothetical protein CSB37_00190 [bacterium DOLZORAL124_38_8]|nr:MAG: hypothetical protein CSB37_00190 [bacterium DOLZORAL124_38_8]
MKLRGKAFFVILLLSIAVGFFSWYATQIKQMKAVFLHASQAEISVETLDFLVGEVSNLPQIWPISAVKSDLVLAQSILSDSRKLQKIEEPLNNLNKIFEQLLVLNSKTQELLNRLQYKIALIPRVFISSEQQKSLSAIEEKLALVKQRTAFLSGLETTLNYLYSHESRVILLLQNTNEPRPTGGFMGSFIQIDFKKDKTFAWKFRDVYSIDRKVPMSAQSDAPEWFYGLSHKISLRDANFHPDFVQSGAEIIRLMEAAGEKSPEILGAINLDVVGEILDLTGPIPLKKWDLVLNSANYDLVLQFLVEGKVLGRFNVKEPVLLFVKELFSPATLSRISVEELKKFDYEGFLKQKNIQLYSPNSAFQTLFVDWGITNQMQMKNEVDNFIKFDFVSIGANKSEKFVWTKTRLDSTIFADGKVENVLKITRNNMLRPQEIQDLLGINKWSDNMKDLLNDELLWKIGQGQNRTMVRVFVPKDAQLAFGDSVSGTVTEVEDEQFKIFEVPMFVSPGEKITATLKYYTNIKRGSLNWRPYNLQMVGTPAKSKGSFMTTIDTDTGGKFSAETFNVGRPVQLVDQFFKAVVEF